MKKSGNERDAAEAYLELATRFPEGPKAELSLIRRAEIECGLGAALGFGFYLILISETSDGAGLWTIVAARVGEEG